MNKSQINPILTMNYMTQMAENKYFDRKSAKIKPADLAEIISAFANAEGGTIVIGISDKTREIEGINDFGDTKINSFINAPKTCCKPMPMFEEEFIEVKNKDGKEDRILLLHIHASIDQIIRTTNDSTYLRIGDQTRELKGDDLRNLEYSKNTRHYEDEINIEATIDDLDEGLINEYKKQLGAENLPTAQVLQARGFLRNKENGSYLTNAAVLLFAKNISQFYPNCRIRFVRYSGEVAKVGVGINIVKDYSIEQPILKLIGETKQFISSQLREFMSLNTETGKFQSVPEYPEFAWLEGIVNAVTHREYGMTGSYILVSMYDDRLEIKSPGKLPSIVTVNNIRETRYSRNPRIARVLTDFGWVRELNEGVKRIYSDMEEYFLEEPIFAEPEQSVLLTLKNNIVMRSIRMKDSAVKTIGADVWKQLDIIDRKIVVFISERKATSRAQLEIFTKKSGSTISKRLKKLIDMKIIQRNGSPTDPKQTYSLS